MSDWAFFPLAQVVNDYTILALARHWDMPVKLMDWTYNPLTAARFAFPRGKDASRQGYALIWALDLSNKEHMRIGPDFSTPSRTVDDKKDIETCVVFRPPSIDNVRLQNQDGLFTLVRATSDPLDHWFEQKMPGKSPLRFFRLRQEDSATKFLDTVGVDEDRLMPSVQRAVTNVTDGFDGMFLNGVKERGGCP